MMKIAVTYENGQIFQHFGHTEQFKIYEAAEGRRRPAAAAAAGCREPTQKDPTKNAKEIPL